MQDICKFIAYFLQRKYQHNAVSLQKPSNTNNMDRGEYLKVKMKEHGFTIDMLASSLEIHPATVWSWMTNADCPLSKMKEIADIIKLDLRNDFPESESLYTSPVKNYETLYLKELERNRQLQEEL